MNITALYSLLPGSRILISCPQKDQEAMVSEILYSMPATLKEKTALNSTAFVSMDLTTDSNPNTFRDLSVLCTKLILGAGKRSHFEGLLLLNIMSLVRFDDTSLHLKALGELLAMPNGLASRCITVLYGPAKESELLFAANCLDFDGKMKTICYEAEPQKSLSALLNEASLICDSPEVEQILETILNDMSANKDFNANLFIRICGNEQKVITKSTVFELVNNSYSYINRIKRMKSPQAEKLSKQKIGFHTPN